MQPYRFTVYKELEFAAAHFLREYHGKCERLHGHNYRVQVHVSCNKLDAEGMVVDFAELKRAMREVTDPFDHGLLNEIPPFDELAPSSERLAEYIAEGVASRIDDGRVKVTECRIWETGRNCAIYRRG